MRGSQHKSGVPQQATLRIVRVESAQPYGWVVYIEGFAETHHFMSRSLALMYAHEWAKGNAPSVIRIVGLDGRTELEQHYNG